MRGCGLFYMAFGHAPQAHGGRIFGKDHLSLHFNTSFVCVVRMFLIGFCSLTIESTFSFAS